MNVLNLVQFISKLKRFLVAVVFFSKPPQPTDRELNKLYIKLPATESGTYQRPINYKKIMLFSVHTLYNTRVLVYFFTRILLMLGNINVNMPCTVHLEASCLTSVHLHVIFRGGDIPCLLWSASPYKWRITYKFPNACTCTSYNTAFAFNGKVEPINQDNHTD